MTKKQIRHWQRFHERRNCKRKVRQNLPFAIFLCLRYRWRGKPRLPYPYHCQVCKGWHLACHRQNKNAWRKTMGIIKSKEFVK